MAKNTDVLIRVVGVNDTDKATSEAIKNIEAVGNAGKKASKETKKDWGGVTNLFSSVLPRGLQRTMRQFKSTTRSVGRLSKGFKVLKAAWAAVGIGAIIIALELLVENWDKVTDAINGTTSAQKAQAKATLAGEDATRSATSEMGVYLDVLQDENALAESRLQAMNELIKKTGLLRDVNVESVEGQKQVKKVYDDYISNLEKEATLKSATASLDAKKAEVDKKSYADLSVLQMAKVTALLNFGLKETAANKAVEYSLENKLKIEAEILSLKKLQRVAQDEYALTESTILKDLAAQAEIMRKSEEEERASDAKRQARRSKAAKIKADLARQAEADLKYLADLEKRVSEEIMLAKIEDDLLRAEEELKLRTKEQVMKALAAGATADQLLLIEEKYLMDLAELREGFKESSLDEGKTPEQIVQEQQALQDEMFLILMSEQDREETLLMQKYDRRIELANGNRELELEAEKIFLDEMKALTEDSEAKIQSIKEAGIKATVNAARGLFSTMGKMAEEGSAQAKALAITDVLLAQAVSLANGIKVATRSAATPYDMAAGIITAIASVMGAFVGVKAILNEAGTSAGGGDGGTPSTTPLVPDQVSRTETTGKAFVVQSDLEGAALQANQLYSQTALGGG
jgi:hypothetical protein